MNPKIWIVTGRKSREESISDWRNNLYKDTKVRKKNDSWETGDHKTNS